jgi:hypothetical protein
MRSFVTTVLTVALLTLLVGCDSVVERTEPSQSVSQGVALSNPDAIQGIRASMYDRMHTEALSTDWLLGPSAIADNTFFRGNQERHQGLNRNLRRDGILTLGDHNGYEIIYDMINDANILINGIQEDALSEAEANKLEAEGRFIRALAMHHAVRVFGYDPNGDGGVVSPNSGPGQGFELGIEIRTTPTLDVEDATSKPRSPVPEVYDQIVSDLEQAISIFQNLPGGVKENSEFYPSEAAAQALLARVRLYQRDWGAADTRAQNAIDLASATFGSGLASPDSGSVRSIFDERNSNPEAIFTIATDPNAGESPGINEAISAYTTIQWIAQLPTQDLVGLYESGDARLAAWYDPCFDEVNSVKPTGCSGVNDAGYELTKWSSEQAFNQYADNHQHLRVAEMYLIQAEARLKQQGGGVSQAIARLNDLRSERGASTLDASNYNQTSAMDEILDERRRELVAEGHRFFDLKRLGRDIRKVQGREDIPFRDIRILDDLPEDQLAVNDSLQQNPGY